MSRNAPDDAFPTIPLLSFQTTDSSAATGTESHLTPPFQAERRFRTSDSDSLPNPMFDSSFDPYRHPPWSGSPAKDPNGSDTDFDVPSHELLSARLGNHRHLHFTVALPALVSAIAVAGAATTLVVYLISRRITAHDSSQKSTFHGAIVAHEPAVNNVFSSFAPTAGATSNSNGSSSATEITLYGLALSSVAVSPLSFFV